MPWCSARVEACSNSSRLTLGHFVLPHGLWPGPGLGCPRREADPCPSSLSSVCCPTPLPAPHLQRQWSFLMPSKQAVTGMPDPISRSQALILCLCPSVCLSVSLLLPVTGWCKAETPAYPFCLCVPCIQSHRGPPGSMLGDAPACVLLHLSRVLVCLSLAHTHLRLLSLSLW